MPPLRLITLGRAELLRPDHSKQLLGPGKPLALLSYLALSPGRSASREFLLELLWADAAPEQGRHALRQALWQLRQHLGDDALTGREEITLTCDLRSDRDTFLVAVERGELEQAVSLYSGPFFPDFASPGGATFEQWADLERERLRSIYLRSAETIIRRKILSGQARECVGVARRIREVGRAEELGYRLAIDSHLALADFISAAGDAEALERWAAQEAMPLDQASRETIRRARNRSIADGEAPPPQADGARLIADLVGREREFAAALATWDAARRGEPRHLHIVAPAGLGKTRLLHDLRARLIAARGQAKYTRANPGDRAIPGALLGDIAGALATLPGAMGISRDAAATLVALDPALSARYNVSADTTTGPDVRRRRALALGELLAAAAHEKPFALLIDDLHWADSESLAVLEAVLARIDGLPALFVTATRPMPDQQLRSERRETLHLDPLTAEHINTLLASLGQFENAGQQTDLVAQLTRASGGSPLLVLELLQLALERGVLTLCDNRWQLGERESRQTIFTEGEGIRQRLSRLSSDGQRIVRTLATAGGPLPARIVAEACGLNEETAANQLLTLERRGFVHQRSGAYEPSHDEIAESALQLWHDQLHETQHGLAAALATASGDDPAWLPHAARHAVAVGDVGLFTRLVLMELARSRHLHPRPTANAVIEQLAGVSGDQEFRAAARQRLPLKVRLRPTTAAPAAVLITIAALTILVLAWRSQRTPVDTLLAFGMSDSTGVLLEIDPLVGESRGALIPHQRRIGSLLGPVAPGSLRMSLKSSVSDDGKSALFALTPPNSGNIDIYQISAGDTTRLTTTERDDVAPSYVAGGSKILFLTSRWSPMGDDATNVATLDLKTGEVARITATSHVDGTPIQSPDGTRIAFVRNHADARAKQLCIVYWNGEGERCHAIEGYHPQEVVGWLDIGTVAVVAETFGRSVVLKVKTGTGELQVLDNSHVVNAAISPGGDFIACICEKDPKLGNQVVVYPARNPEAYRTLDPTESHDLDAIVWRPGAPDMRYLDSIRIDPVKSIPAGSLFTLRYSARGPRGNSIVLDTTVIRWSVSDSTVASIDPNSGQLRAVRQGRTWAKVSAGGWRQDSLLLVLTESAAQSTMAKVIFEESWTDAMSKWHAFGTPPGHTAKSALLGPAFVNGGDDNFPSGAYSEPSFDPAYGLTLETRISTPITQVKFQYLVLELRASRDNLSATWDHQTGSAPFTAQETRRVCGLLYPTGEVVDADRIVTVESGRRNWGNPAPPTLRTGRPHLVRVTLFPDATCGLAIDGVPVQRSRNPIPLDQPFRIWIHGMTVKTQIAVGPLKVWQGDPGGVDWEALNRPKRPSPSGTPPSSPWSPPPASPSRPRH